MPSWASPWELVLLTLILLLIFGPKRLPEIGRSLGRGMREFKNTVTGRDATVSKSTELPPPADGQPDTQRTSAGR